MGIYNNFKTLDSKFSWSFLGFLIGILGIVYAIYIDQFKEEKPQVIFDILSNTQVLSVKENLNKLDIIYDGQNLKEKKENLILLTIRISNEGNEDIRESDYYSKAPFGFKINNGKIAERPTIINSSSKILKDNLTLTYDTLNNITLNKVPFNQDQSFTIKVLTICNENTLPTITPLGNIAGINEVFAVKQSFKDGQKEDKSFFQVLTFGSLGIHIARFFFYIFSIVALGLLIVIPSTKISTHFEDKKRKVNIKKFRNKTKIQLSDKVELIFEIYKNDGEHYIKWLNRILEDKEMISKYFAYFENWEIENLLMIDYTKNGLVDNEIEEGRIDIFSTAQEIISKLIERKFILKENNEIIIDEQFKTELREFNYFIDIQ